MSQKRHPEDGKAKDESSCSEDKRRRIPEFRSLGLEVMKMQSVQHLLEPILEPLIRRVVKEELELSLRKHLNCIKRNCGTETPPSGTETHPSEVRSLQLQFLNSLSLPVFTGTRIEGEECSYLRIALVDALTGKIIDYGPESSAKVEIVVLEGDFDGDEGNDWTHEEFKNNIVREREGKKPLLTGDVSLNLKEGTGCVGEICFTDNSSWTRSRKFRLGARVVDNADGTRTREAKTGSFIVRDHRGELYKKHHPPSLFDEVWRLEKIGKEGAFHKRLSQENIKTVKDFLTLLFIDAPRLRNILGTGMSAKMWEVTLEHARRCVLDKRMYLYWSPGSQQKSGLVFNVVGQVLGVLSEYQYIPVDKLSETEKADSHNLVISAFEHWEEVLSFDEETSLTGGSLHLTDVLYPSSSPRTESSNCNKLSTSHKIDGFDYTQSVAASPDILSSMYSIGDLSSLDDYSLPIIENTSLRFDQPLNFPGEVTNSMTCEAESMTQAFCDEDHLRFFDINGSHQPQNPNLESQADLQSAFCNFLYTSSTAVAVDKAQRRWTKIFSVIKWFSIRKKVALRKTHVPEIHKYS